MKPAATREQRGSWSWILLLRRLYTTFLGDPRSAVFLILQPLVIAVLLSLVCPDLKSIPRKLFFFHIAVQWFACSNAAQVIVRERAVFLRERLAGLRLHSYLFANLFGMGLLATLQMLFLYALLKFLPNGLTGDPVWQLTAGLGSAWAMTAVGIFISAACASSTKAVLIVPLVIIPQILAAGFVFPMEKLRERPLVALACAACPSHAAQRLIDISLLWNRKLDRDTLTDEGISTPTMESLELSLVPWSVHFSKADGTLPVIPAQRLQEVYAPDASPLTDLSYAWPKKMPRFEMGRTYRHRAAVAYPLFLLGGWLLFSSLASLVVMSRTE
jgi:hypothetical protein